MYGIIRPGEKDLDLDMRVSTMEIDEKYLVAYDRVGFQFKARNFDRYTSRRSLIGRLAYDISQGLSDIEIQDAEWEKKSREKRWKKYKTMTRDELLKQLNDNWMTF